MTEKKLTPDERAELRVRLTSDKGPFVVSADGARVLVGVLDDLAKLEKAAHQSLGRDMEYTSRMLRLREWYYSRDGVRTMALQGVTVRRSELASILRACELGSVNDTDVSRARAALKIQESALRTRELELAGEFEAIATQTEIPTVLEPV